MGRRTGAPRLRRNRINYAYPPGPGYWSISRQPGARRFLGWVMLVPLDLAGPDIEIGWRPIRAEWGRGYATEAARPILAHAFQTIRLQEVMADIDARNTGSRRVAEKLGMAAAETSSGGASTIRYVARRECRLGLADIYHGNFGARPREMTESKNPAG
ncbi:MAG: GNAT family N-acetyltransferase [Pseudomonadota bacterium]|nr:GNAT family N-acetyltransferase [Pseudomonadota bacterium]